ncbi:MAG: methyltransferase domain-containing protein [Opitutaceae bacterium]|nr:methyltransferase domain-containing protein [Cytophagales bacterium]
MDLVQQQHWDKGYQEIEFQRPEEDDFLRKALLQYIPKTKTGRAIEIGCFPGGYLSVLGDLGYELNGVDLTPKTNGLIEILRNYGYKTGVINMQDFMNLRTDEKFQAVVSFGFIEHFKNYDEVLLKHASLVDQNGILFISTPNYKGIFQYLFHLLFDTPGLKRHNIASMNPQKWASVLEEIGFEVIFSGYGGGANFWMENDQSSIQKFMGRAFLFLHKKIGKIFKFNYNNWNNKRIACDCLVVAKRIR